MSSKFEYSVSYPSSVPALWSLISTEQYWRELVQATNAGHGALESFAIDGDTVTVVTTQGVGAENLPSVVTAVRPGDLEIPRTSVFRLVGETIAGSMKADVKGAPATIEGDITISGDPAVASYLGDANVGIPFVGGKIEKAIIEQVGHLLDAERDATVEFLQR